MQNVTELEAKMIKAIAEDEFTPLNGVRPTRVNDATTWADCVINTPADKGVFTSLLKKNLAIHHGTGRDAVVSLTDDGFKVYQAL